MSSESMRSPSMSNRQALMLGKLFWFWSVGWGEDSHDGQGKLGERRTRFLLLPLCVTLRLVDDMGQLRSERTSEWGDGGVGCGMTL